MLSVHESRAIGPAHLTETPVVRVQSAVDTPEMMCLEVRREESTESEIEAVPLLIAVADETQRLEGFHELSPQRAELVP